MITYNKKQVVPPKKNLIIYDKTLSDQLIAQDKNLNIFVYQDGNNVDPKFDFSVMSGEVWIQSTFPGKLSTIAESLIGAGCTPKVATINEDYTIAVADPVVQITKPPEQNIKLFDLAQATQVRHLFAQIPIFLTRPTNEFKHLHRFLI